MTAALLALVLAADPRSALEQQCRTQAADPHNPWALAHGILAFGPSFRASDGRRAADVIVHDFARADPSRPGRFAFPPFEGGEPVDPHPNHTVASLLDSGLPLTERFALDGGAVTLGELAQGVVDEASAASLSSDWPSQAWTLEVLADVHSPKLAALEPLALEHLERQQAFLGEAMDRGEASVPKQHQGIWDEPCGGLHFIEAVMAGARDPALRHELAPRLARQQAILFYRLEAEHAAYRQALAKAPADLVLAVLAQQLKFYGHWLEAIGLMQRDGVLVPSARQLATIAEGRRLLAETATALDQRGAFAQMPSLWRTQHQLALDLTGDACHAVRGLALTEPLRRDE